MAFRHKRDPIAAFLCWLLGHHEIELFGRIYCVRCTRFR